MALRKTLASRFKQLDEDNTVRWRRGLRQRPPLCWGRGPEGNPGLRNGRHLAPTDAALLEGDCGLFQAGDCRLQRVGVGGGCELALHAHTIIAARSAAFGQPEIRLNMMPGGGATQGLVKAIGKYRTVKLVLTGWSVRAEEARSLGMVSEVAPDDAWMQRALDMAAQKEGVQSFLGRGKPGGVAPRQLANGGGRAATTHP
jgi:hypothetical protein